MTYFASEPHLIVERCPRMVRLLIGFLALTLSVRCQGVITTIAGTDYVFPAGPQSSSSVLLRQPQGIAADAAGNCYVTDAMTQLVLKITPSGSTTVVAGNGFFYYSGDGGPATSAGLFDPISATFDSAGNLYIVDSGSARIRRVDTNGIITTVAGNGPGRASPGDGGPATAATLYTPADVAVDKAGNIYIAESNGNRVRRVDVSGTITTYAGTGSAGYSGDGGPATKAMIAVNGIAVDAQQNLYIADRAHNVIRRVTAQGVISTIAGGTVGAPVSPQRIAADGKGTVYFTQGNSVMQIIGGVVSTLVTDPLTGFYAISATSGGSLCVTDSTLDIRLISQSFVATIAKGTTVGVIGDGGPALAAYVDNPYALALDGQGGYYIADYARSVVRSVSPKGIIKTVAGTGIAGFSGDGGDATKAQLSSPVSIAVDPRGDLYIADYGNHRIRRISGGVITTYAGGAGLAYNGDVAPLAIAAVGQPTGLAFGPGGQLYFGDGLYGVIRRVNGENLESFLKLGTTVPFTPSSLAFDLAGNLFYCLTTPRGNIIFKVSPQGVITDVAGSGDYDYVGDGKPAKSSPLEKVGGITVDRGGTVYFTEFYTGRVRSVGPDGILRTAAGTFDFDETFGGDGGAATRAHLNRPQDVKADAAGNLFIADTDNHRIREVLASPPSLKIDTTSLSFAAPAGGAPTSMQRIGITGSTPGVQFNITVSPASAAQWLVPSYSSGATPLILGVQANPLSLTPGDYTATIQIAAPLAVPGNQTISVTFHVGPGQPPALQLDKNSLSFTFPRHGTVRSQLVQVINGGGGTLPFTAAASTQSGGGWLKVSPASGTASPGSPALLTVSADPASLQPGTYQGSITVTSGSQSKSVLVIASVSTRDQAMLLGQAGLSFLAVAGGGVVPPQSFGVYNIGTGVMSWTVSTSTLSGGSNWLVATPGQGSSDAASSVIPRVTVFVDPAGLAPGRYYGLVRVDSALAANSPQVATALLEVLPAGQDPGAVVQPQELTFFYPAAGSPPGAQVVSIYNLTATDTNFVAGGAFYQGVHVLGLAPATATVTPRAPVRLVVQPTLPVKDNGSPFATTFPTTTLTLQFDNGVLRQIPVNFNFGTAGAASSTGSPVAGVRGASGCTAQRLVPSLSALGQLATHVNAGWPTALQVAIQDDCGAPSTSGTVIVSFSNGDPPISLQSQSDGSWEGTWQNSSGTSAQVTLLISASDPGRGISGSLQATAGVVGQQEPPVFVKEAVVSNADPVSNVPIGVGSIVSIYGSLLANRTATFSAAPLPTTLGDTQVLIAGQAVPLFYASPGLLNIQIPYDLQPDTTHQILILRGNTYSVPVPVNVAQAQPAAFLYPAAGANAAIAVVVRTQGGATQSFLATPSNPAQAGDTIVLYCTGLGAAGQRIAGQAASTTVLAATQNPVSLSIGGIAVKPDFAGLAPGFVGLYQVNANMPAGIPPGPAVPMTLQVLNLTSPTVSIAVQ